MLLMMPRPACRSNRRYLVQKPRCDSLRPKNDSSYSRYRSSAMGKCIVRQQRAHEELETMRKGLGNENFEHRLVLDENVSRHSGFELMPTL